jgi:hypothetical protein
MHKNSPTVAPLHTGTVNGSPVRFFLSPLQDGLPDFPWSSLDDLICAVGLPDKMRELSASKLQSISAEAMTVATTEGLLTIIPHPDAQGLIQAMAKLRGVDAESDYKFEGAAAFCRQLADLTDKEVMEYSQAAVKRWKK